MIQAIGEAILTWFIFVIFPMAKARGFAATFDKDK